MVIIKAVYGSYESNIWLIVKFAQYILLNQNLKRHLKP